MDSLNIAGHQWPELLEDSGQPPFDFQVDLRMHSEKPFLLQFNELKQKRNHKLMSNGQKKLKTEQAVEITIGSTNVSILCPGKRSASADLLVLMDQDQLSCVFDFLKTDCKDNGKAKRSYKKGGNKPQKDEEAD